MREFKEFFNLPSDKAERKEFLQTFFGEALMLGVGYVFVLLIYFLAPAGYWNGF